MKKFFVSLIALVCALLCLVGCTAVPEKPEDTTLEFWIAEDVSDFDFSGYYEVAGWFGARQFYGKGYAPEGVDEDGFGIEPAHCVKYLVGAYPDASSRKQCVKSIDITDPSVTVYGLSCNSSFADFDAVMADMGYTIETHDTFHRATRGKISFSLVSTETTKELSVRAEASNKFGIEY